MSQLTQSQVSIPRASRRSAGLALAALAAAAAIAIALVLALSAGQSVERSTSNTAAQPAARSDGGPEETLVGASSLQRRQSTPDEARIAASIVGR